MARHASAIAAAELRVVQSRRKLRDDLRRARWRLVGIAGTVAAALIRHALKHRAS